MKVGSTKPNAPVQTAKLRKEASKSIPVDRVSANEKRHLDALTKRALETAKMLRSERLAAIQAQVRSGTFRPDPSRIAEEILREAEIDAQLRAVFEEI